jgi:malate permease and related proteins
MSFATELTQFGILFIVIAAGYLIGRTKLLSANARGDIANVVLYISVPASIIYSMDIPMSPGLLYDFFLLVCISLGVFLFTMLFSLVSARLLAPKDPVKRSIYSAAIYFNNYGFMGWPVCNMFFPTNGLLYASVFSIPLHFVLYLVTPAMLSKACGKQEKHLIRNILNPPVIATIVAVILFLTQVKLPAIFDKTLEMLSYTQTPLAMLVVGMTLSKMNFKSIFKNGRAYIYAALKLIVLPLMVFAILKLIGLHDIMLGVPVLLSAMPAGTMVIVLAYKYSNDNEFVTQLLMLSTVLSLATIPLFSLLV